ncbi:Glycosyltransferase family 10 (fucosyltransferase) [Hoeflea sp. IMCC20628]|uniref:glycosyltransferase family 10 domain-containing protein n=1 Tax=Hoeflea sp. IMCC20628 TaxID=1620421 RepID=UPI00063B084D|nr:glycosyltransferase family 10 [Hoeflea sp. IMCC20628]AKI02413.1 Glycosyltransferase family 10 (fucosyltransferase) [Hoeflea sp. IMCC20628]
MTDSSFHKDTPAVALLPYGTRITLRLSKMPLDALIWPLGRPARLLAGTISDLGPDDHLLAYLNSRLLYMPRPGVRARVSVMVVEPQAVHGRKMAWLKLLWRRFHLVLSSNAGLLAAVPNSTRFLFGSTWVPDWRNLTIEKTRLVSLIASAKDYYPGHKLRHQVVARLRERGTDVDILGRGYAPFDKKSDGLAPYCYSIIIENVREPGYFTEKLIDCLLCETIPIYWGAPDIGDVFDMRGMIIANDLAAITAAIGGLSDEDYQARLEFVRLNRDKASRYADQEKAAASIVMREGTGSRKTTP